MSDFSQSMKDTKIIDSHFWNDGEENKHELEERVVFKPKDFRLNQTKESSMNQGECESVILQKLKL